MKARLRAAQVEVTRSRALAPWPAIAQRCDLETLDQDILACVTAPDADPHLGWLFQDLQPTLVSAYPTPALIRELLFVGADEAAAFHGRLAETAPLRRHRLIDSVPADPYRPLHPTARGAGPTCWAGRPTARWRCRARSKCRCRPAGKTSWLPVSALRSLREFLLWMSGRERVERDWGARAWGGPAALFCGPPGTGKTMAAQVLASDRLDACSGRPRALVSASTSARPRRTWGVFDAAERAVMLFFDEADALFGSAPRSGRARPLRQHRDRLPAQRLEATRARSS